MKNHKATASLVGILVGIIIIIIGLCVQGISVNAYRTDIGEDIKFGADFYTEIYAVTQDVGAAINSLKYTVATAVESVCDAIGWMIVSLGAIDVCFFAYKYIDDIHALRNKSCPPEEEYFAPEKVKTNTYHTSKNIHCDFCLRKTGNIKTYKKVDKDGEIIEFCLCEECAKNNGYL